jgi:hypothetical protein
MVRKNKHPLIIAMAGGFIRCALMCEPDWPRCVLCLCFVLQTSKSRYLYSNHHKSYIVYVICNTKAKYKVKSGLLLFTLLDVVVGTVCRTKDKDKVRPSSSCAEYLLICPCPESNNRSRWPYYITHPVLLYVNAHWRNTRTSFICRCMANTKLEK